MEWLEKKKRGTFTASLVHFNIYLQTTLTFIINIKNV